MEGGIQPKGDQDQQLLTHRQVLESLLQGLEGMHIPMDPEEVTRMLQMYADLAVQTLLVAREAFLQGNDEHGDRSVSEHCECLRTRAQEFGAPDQVVDKLHCLLVLQVQLKLESERQQQNIWARVEESLTTVVRKAEAAAAATRIQAVFRGFRARRKAAAEAAASTIQAVFRSVHVRLAKAAEKPDAKCERTVDALVHTGGPIDSIQELISGINVPSLTGPGKPEASEINSDSNVAMTDGASFQLDPAEGRDSGETIISCLIRLFEEFEGEPWTSLTRKEGKNEEPGNKLVTGARFQLYLICRSDLPKKQKMQIVDANTANALVRVSYTMSDTGQLRCLLLWKQDVCTEDPQTGLFELHGIWRVRKLKTADTIAAALGRVTAILNGLGTPEPAAADSEASMHLAAKYDQHQLATLGLTEEERAMLDLTDRQKALLCRLRINGDLVLVDIPNLAAEDFAAKLDMTPTRAVKLQGQVRTILDQKQNQS
jgi:hypothetical protein